MRLNIAENTPKKKGKQLCRKEVEKTDKIVKSVITYFYGGALYKEHIVKTATDTFISFDADPITLSLDDIQGDDTEIAERLEMTKEGLTHLRSLLTSKKLPIWNVDEFQEALGVDTEQFANMFNIPYDVVKRWKNNEIPEYTARLMHYKANHQGWLKNKIQPSFTFSLPKTITELRKIMGVTQQQCAEMFDIQVRVIQRWETSGCPDYIMQLMYYKANREGWIM